MKLSIQCSIKSNETEMLVLDSFGFNAYKLWNVANYEKHNFEKLGMSEFPNWYEQKKRLKNNYFFKNLPSQTAQEVLNVLQQSWKSYFKLQKTGGIENSKPPRYKQSAIPFAFLNKGFKHIDNVIKLTIPKATKQYIQDIYNLKIEYVILKSDIFKKFSNIKQIKLSKQGKEYKVIIVYEVEDKCQKTDNGCYLFIDGGINNLFTCYDTANKRSFIIGKKYLALQYYFNKQIAYYQSISDSQQAAKGIKYPKKSKRVSRLHIKKSNSINDYIYKMTAYIRKYCIDNNINVVVMGDVSNILKSKKEDAKFKTNKDKQSNQKLHAWPFAKIYQQLYYKLAMEGIQFIKQKECYSSQCPPASPVVSKLYAKEEQRVQRGLYVNDNNVYNADAVGAYNIGRLAMQEKRIQQIDMTINLSYPQKEPSNCKLITVAVMVVWTYP